MRKTPLLVALLGLAAIPAPAHALSPEGAWVSAEARRLLQEGRAGDPGCYLVVTEEGSAVEESCAEATFPWPSVSVTRSGSTIEIRSVDADLARRLVLRPGAPSELEVRIERGGESDFHRLYRLEDRYLPALETLRQVRDHLLGDWETEDGVELTLGGDGSYRFGGDVGRFRAEGGFLTEAGAWVALFFEPEGGGPVRRYLLHGRGERIGLAEVPRDVELLVAAPEAEAEPEEKEAEEVVVEGIAIPLPTPSSAEHRVLPPGVEEPAPRIWLQRPTPKDEEGKVAERETSEPGEGDAELPAIAQPIRPVRSCGCAASEAGFFGAVLLPGLWLARRRR